jgi:hypothetical protein
MAMADAPDPTMGGDWWTANAPPPLPGFTPNPGKGTVVPPGSPPLDPNQPVPAQYLTGGTSWQGGGWTNPRGTAAGLAKAFAMGLRGQAAVDWTNANGYPGIAFYADKNQYGLPDGQYIAPNPSNPNTFDLIQRTGTEGGSSGGNAANPGALPVTDFGGIGSSPSPYVNPTWTGGPAPTAPTLTSFTVPTEAQLEASPGYESRRAAGQLGMERSAAAQGSVLSGGTQQALARYNQDYASNEYANLFGQTLSANVNNNNVTQGNFGNAFQTYQANYGQFTDAANRGASTYQMNVTNRRNAGLDYWNQLNDLYQTGAGAANNSYKPSNVP